MRKRSIALFAGLAVVGATYVGLNGTAGGVTAAHEYNHVLQVVLSGRNEVAGDGQLRAGDANAFGSFSGVIKGRRLCYGIQVVDIAEPAAAHIHRGKAGVNGPVLVTLETPNAQGRGAAVSTGCTRVSRAVAEGLVKAPRRYYVNVHNAAFPDGAVRGQLVHPRR